MKIINNYPLADIIISEDFKKTTPAERKLKAAAKTVQSAEDLTGQIIINDENVLIDGYTYYLAAMNKGLGFGTVTRGYVEIVEAKHAYIDKSFMWRVPLRLYGQLQKGDKCIVRTSRGVKRVTVNNIIRQQYPTQEPQLRYVLRIDRKVVVNG